MEVKSVEKKEHSIAAVTVEVSSEEFDKAVSDVYKKSRNSIAVPGFRKGKAPRKIIESMYGASVFYEDAINDIIPDAYMFAVKEENLKTVANPTVESADVTDSKSLVLVINAVLHPEVTLNEYKGLEAVRKEVKIDPYEIEAEIEALRNRNSTISTVDRASHYGDIVVIDYEGSVDDVPFEGGKGEMYELEIGSNSFIPGFEVQCIGASAGDDISVNVTFPQDYRAEELAGKAAVFKVKVHEVKERVLPELDDEFAKDVSEYDTLEEYRKSIHDNIQKKKTEALRNEFLDLLMEKLVENMEADIPEAMILERAQRMVDDYAERIKSQGIEFDTYLQLFNMDRDSFVDNIKNTAEKQVKGELALMKVAEIEAFVITDEEREAEYERLSGIYNIDVEGVKNYFDKKLVDESIMMTKSADFIIENAVALPEPEEAEQDSEQKESNDEAENAQETTGENAGNGGKAE